MESLRRSGYVPTPEHRRNRRTAGRDQSAAVRADHRGHQERIGPLSGAQPGHHPSDHRGNQLPQGGSQGGRGGRAAAQSAEVHLAPRPDLGVLWSLELLPRPGGTRADRQLGDLGGRQAQPRRPPGLGW